VSRLEFAPKLKEIQITDITKGIAIFAPKPDKPVSFALLQSSLKKAGYKLDSAEITVVGTLERDENKEWWLVADPVNQRFALAGASVDKALTEAEPNSRIEITGDWKTSVGNAPREVISLHSVRKTESSSKIKTISSLSLVSEADGARFGHAALNLSPRAPSVNKFPVEALTPVFAPIRTTTPGLTVYKGGAIASRILFIKQHLRDLNVNRQALNVSASYTPTPRLQLEVEVPFTRTAFNNSVSSGANEGLGNITLWTKYRFFRRLETYGDKQAAVRLGLELPTGRNDASGASQINAHAFVRQQLTPISGGLSPIVDLAYSQAIKRFIYGGNVAAILRSERDGYRTGHELRVNTDTEYVIFPFKYRRPTRELFAILETNFIHHGRGRVNGLVAPDSNATEFYLAPGLQYVATPRIVFEGSFQVPVVRNTGALVLRTDRNILLDVKYLF
jgi:hypothetical protein